MINAPRWVRKEYMKMIVSEKELCISNEADSSSSVRHRKAIIALLVIAAVLIAALAGAWTMFGTQLTAAMTIEKLDDHLWSMEYKGDYGFDGFLEQGGAKSDAEMGDYIASFLSHGSDTWEATFPATERPPVRRRPMWSCWTCWALTRCTFWPHRQAAASRSDLPLIIPSARRV